MRADPIDLNEYRKSVDKDAAVQRFARQTNDRGAPLRSQILELNQTLREAQQQMGHLDIGSCVMRIPEFDFYLLLRRFPDLNSTDPTENANAWEKFLRSPYSDEYRIRKHDGKQRRRGEAATLPTGGRGY